MMWYIWCVSNHQDFDKELFLIVEEAGLPELWERCVELVGKILPGNFLESCEDVNLGIFFLRIELKVGLEETDF